MSKLVCISESIVSNNTGLDAITRAPIVEYKTKYRCLRIQNVSHNESFDKWGYTEVTEENYKKFQLKKDDIIISRTGGSIGTLMYIDKDYPAVYNNGLIRLKINKNKYNPRYIYYCLKLNLFKKHIEQCSLGNSTQENIRMNDLIKYKIPDLSIQIQNKIVKILGGIDDKIENNNKINVELENIAKTIYDYWFLQFDFPDENGKPYKSSGGKMVWNEELKKEIPEGWEVKQLDDFGRLTMGQSPKSDSYNEDGIGMPLINGAAELKNDRIEITKYTSKPTRISHKNDLLFCIRATIGNLRYGEKEYCLGRGVAAFTSYNNSYNEYMYFVINNILDTYKKVLVGSIIVGITKDDLLEKKNINPQNDVINAFSQKMKPLVYKIRKNEKQNQQLTSLRDFLLSLLMNGQVGFKEK